MKLEELRRLNLQRNDVVEYMRGSSHPKGRGIRLGRNACMQDTEYIQLGDILYLSAKGKSAFES